MMNILLCLLGIILVVFIITLAYCFLCRIKFNQILNGPSLFLYKYHIGSYYSMDKTFNPFKDALDKSNTKEIISNTFNIPINELKLIPASLFVEAPETVKQSELHTAVGFIVKLKSDTQYWKVDKDKLLNKMQIDLARIRIWPTCNWIVAFYPHLSWFDPLSYIIGRTRVFGIAAKRGYLKAPPIEIYPGNSKEYTGKSDDLITYVMPQNNTELYYMDPHVCFHHPPTH
eukprot:UN11147